MIAIGNRAVLAAVVVQVALKKALLSILSQKTPSSAVSAFYIVFVLTGVAEFNVLTTPKSRNDFV